MRDSRDNAIPADDFLAKTFEKLFNDSFEAQRRAYPEKALLYAGALMALSHAYPDDPTLARLLREEQGELR